MKEVRTFNTFKPKMEKIASYDRQKVKLISFIVLALDKNCDTWEVKQNHICRFKTEQMLCEKL